MRPDAILYLPGGDVATALQAIDVVDAVASALAAHASGRTVLPAEAYMSWTHEGETLRNLSMPAVVEDCPGVKLINANPANPLRGLPRASGLTVLFETATGRPMCILEGAQISCIRTAAVSALAAATLEAKPTERLAVLGAGALARCHLELLPRRLRHLREIRIYDVDAARAGALAEGLGAATVCESPEHAVRGADLVVPVTTTTSGYIRHDWLEPGSLLVNVSLDDALPEVVLRADKVFVDDWSLVAADERRLLGRMLRAGEVRGPNDAANGSRQIDGELGELLIGTREGRSRPDEIIVVNPFGLAIEDIAVARRVYERALEIGLGIPLER